MGQVLGEAAVAAGRTNTFLGDRYRRLARRRGGARATVAVGRSILVIIWHLLADPDARYRDLGSDTSVTGPTRDGAPRTHVRQLKALGYTVTLTRRLTWNPHLTATETGTAAVPFARPRLIFGLVTTAPRMTGRWWTSQDR